MTEPFYQAGGVTLYRGRMEDVEGLVGELCLSDTPQELGTAWTECIAADRWSLLVSLEMVPAWMAGSLGTPDTITVWRRRLPTKAGMAWDALLHWGDTPPDWLYIEDLAPRDTRHPAERGLGLWTMLLADLAPASVVDPFCGSGTTLLAAKALGIPAIGVEVDPAYCELIVRRLESA